MERQASIYHFYKSIPMQVFRAVVVIFLSILIFSNIGAEQLPKAPLLLLSLVLMHEVFFRFHVSKYKPIVTVSENDGHKIVESFTLLAAEIFVTQKSVKKILSSLLSQTSIKFILKKSEIDSSEIKYIDIAKDELGKKAFAIASGMEGGKFVTTMDLFAAYILLSEHQTQMLFNKKLKEDEFLHIVYWTCVDFPQEENPKPTRVDFWGEGIGEGWVTGWTIETKKYAFDLTSQILQSSPVIIGREKEYKELVEGLTKKEDNNVLLVGQSGAGKENLVSYFGHQSFAGNVPESLSHRRIFKLMIGPLIAGTSSRSDLEVRLQTIIEELSHSLNIILYIPYFENIMNMSFGANLSSALMPYLRGGKMPVVATITPGLYKQFVEENAIQDVFSTIRLDAPTRDVAIKMVLEQALSIEQKEKVILTYKAIVSSVDLASRYFSDHSLPGAAISLLLDTAHGVSLSKKTFVEEGDVVQKIEEKTHIAVAAPKEEEKEVLLHLENKLHQRVVDQQEAISVISEAMRRARTGLSSLNRPISFLFLGPTGVGKTETAKALAAVYFNAQNRMIRLDMSEYAQAASINRLLGAKPGEGDERGELTDKVHDNPFSLVLLDEFEKAHPQILDLFLQVLDDGRLTDNKGRTVSFVNTIIIATSNAASEFIREEVTKGVVIDKSFHQRLLSFLQEKGIFKPELLNRFDDIVTFKPLGEKEVIAITKLLLFELDQKLKKQDILVSFDEKVVEKIAKEGFDQQFGARPLRRYIQDNIEDLLSAKILKNEIQRGSTIHLLTDYSDSIIVSSS